MNTEAIIRSHSWHPWSKNASDSIGSVYSVVKLMAYLFAYRRYRLALRAPLRTAHGLWSEREGLMVRLEDENGRVGFGEVAPIPWFGTETMAEAEETCGKFGDKVGDTLLDAVPERMGCLRFALATARSGQIATRSDLRVPLTALLPAGRGAIEVLLARLEGGWLSFKWKVGVGEPDQELGLLDELLERLPAYAQLRLDANGAWTRHQAIKWLERCAERPIEFVEQPVAPADVDSLLGLAQDYPVKLALDESLVRLEEARQWQARGWPGVFVIKPALAGPLAELVAWFDRTDPDVVLSSAIETALGRAAIWQFVLGSCPGLLKRAPGFGVGEIFGDRRWDGPFTGPVLDGDWSRGIKPEELWNALA
jgi:O-succinylbenzoate synthase